MRGRGGMNTRDRQEAVPKFGPLSEKEEALIKRIADRAGELLGRGARVTVCMDITACHLNGTPLRLEDLAEADQFNFLHDVTGINRHLNRETGELTGHFLPRFVRREGHL